MALRKCLLVMLTVVIAPGQAGSGPNVDIVV